MSHVQLTTETKNFQITNQTAVTTTVPSRVVTSTQPASGSGAVIMGSSLNYLKFKILSSSTSALTLTITGWSFSPQAFAWVPQTLSVLTTVQNTNAQASFPNVSGNVYEASQYTLSVGDAKIYNSPNATTNGAFVLVDTLGCQFIEVHCSAASGTPTVYILSSGV
jgi:hypothetical protein